MPDTDEITVQIAKETLGPLSDEIDITIANHGNMTLSHSKTKKNRDITFPVRSGIILDAAQSISTDQPVENIYILGEWVYSSGQKQLTHRKEPAKTCDLTDKEVHILDALIACENGFCTRGFLLEDVWGYKTELETHTLETHIYRLRQKLENDSNDPKILLTAESGYKLIFKEKT